MGVLHTRYTWHYEAQCSGLQSNLIVTGIIGLSLLPLHGHVAAASGSHTHTYTHTFYLRPWWMAYGPTSPPATAPLVLPPSDTHSFTLTLLRPGLGEYCSMLPVRGEREADGHTVWSLGLVTVRGHLSTVRRMYGGEHGTLHGHLTTPGTDVGFSFKPVCYSRKIILQQQEMWIIMWINRHFCRGW